MDTLGLSSKESHAEAEATHATSPPKSFLHDDLFSTPAATPADRSSPDIEALFGNAPAAAQSPGIISLPS